MAVDCAGSYTVVPGFVDVHIPGCAGADTCDATREALEVMAAFLLAHGVTSFCPTTMTTSRETIQAALLAAKENSDLPVFVTMTFDGDGKLLTGGAPGWWA